MLAQGTLREHDTGTADKGKAQVTKVLFHRPLSLPLPGLHGAQVQVLETPDHGLYFGTLDMWVHLDTRQLELEMHADTHHLTVWVPLEHVSSWVLRK